MRKMPFCCIIILEKRVSIIIRYPECFSGKERPGPGQPEEHKKRKPAKRADRQRLFRMHLQGGNGRKTAERKGTMAEKDTAEKTLEAYNDVFADIVNVLLFQGRKFVKEEELEEESPHSSYKADGKLHAQERDAAKYWKKGLVRIALYGLENQTAVDRDMPLRLFSYDGAAYRAQLLTDKEMKKKTGRKAPRYPVVTLVLYFGHDRRWKTPVRLSECLEIPEELKPYVNDYRMNLFEVAYLSDEQVQMFSSDFKIVADYFVQMRKNRDYKASEVTIRHVHELLQLMAVMTRDSRFENAYSPEMERRATTMCEVLDRVENRGIEKGIEKGIIQGEDRILGLMNYLLSNNRAEDARKATEDPSYRNRLLAEAESCRNGG